VTTCVFNFLVSSFFKALRPEGESDSLRFLVFGFRLIETNPSILILLSTDCVKVGGLEARSLGLVAGLVESSLLSIGGELDM